MKAIIVEEVDGLAKCIGATALALVWEDRIILDAKLKKTPNLRKNVLWHERRHIMNVRKRGMTSEAGSINFVIEHEYRWTAWAIVGIVALSAVFHAPFLLLLAPVPWLVNHWYWNWRHAPRPQQTFK